MFFTTPSEPDTGSHFARSVPEMALDQRAALIDALLASN
jgi:hypothetical protein